MLINNLFYTILSIIIPIFLWGVLSILVKRKWNSYYGFMAGMILSAFAFAAFQAFGKIYLIEENLGHSCYTIVGSLEYEFADGKQVEVKLGQGETGILNNTKEQLILEELKYSPSGYYKNKPAYTDITRNTDSVFADNLSNSFTITITPLSFLIAKIPKKKIDFFFDEDIPEVIEEYGTYNHNKFWLHRNK